LPATDGGPHDRFLAGLAWSLCGASLLGLGALFVLGATNPESVNQLDDEPGVVISVALFVAAFSVMGGLVGSRQPRNAVGWIMLSAALFYSLAGLTGLVAERLLLEPGRVSQMGLALGWVSGWAWMVGAGPSASLLFLLFPSGRLVSLRWRWVLWVAAAGIALIVASIMLRPGQLDFTTAKICAEECRNPTGIAGAKTVVDVLGSVGGALFICAVIASVMSLFVRYRRAGVGERLQLKWLMYTVVFVLLALVASMVIEQLGGGSEQASNLSNLVVTGALSTIPIAIGVAVLRYRLYDIDLVINRTLVYGSLTTILSLTYFGAVALLQQLLSPVTGRSELAVAGSTLAVAALFRPLRSRVQRFIDRRFYRRKYDAARSLEDFSARLREQTDLESLRSDLLLVVNETIQPRNVSLWLRPAPGRQVAPHSIRTSIAAPSG
jgi:hypothetical protein